MTDLNIEYSPKDYAEHAVIANAVADELIARLEFLAAKPKRVLNVGCGLTPHGQQLAKQFPEAKIINLDSDIHLISELSKPLTVCGDSAKLPLQKNSVDIVVANFVLPWQQQLKEHLAAWQSVLTPNGHLSLSYFGLDTLKECEGFISCHHMPHRLDMHELGDHLIHAGFVDPVIDVCYYTVAYSTRESLLNDLVKSQLWFPSSSLNLESIPEQIELTYEIIFASAFVSDKTTVPAAASGVTHIPVEQFFKKVRHY